MSNIDSPSSDNIYYSPTNSDDELLPLLIIDCNCCNTNNSCFIFCFNTNTNQFESIDCKKFKNLN